MKYWLVLGASLLLVGCGERYRYPCQDPANWHSEQCSKPECEISQTCPEHIFSKHLHIQNTPVARPAQPVKKGECND